MGRLGRAQGTAKKLIEAAQRWAKGSSGDSAASQFEQLQSLRDLGASEEQIAEHIAALDGSADVPSACGQDARAPGELLVMPDNWETVQVFCNLSRCWRIDRMNGVYEGLERPAIESTLRLMGVKAEHHSEVFNGLLVMEEAALAVLNKK